MNPGTSKYRRKAPRRYRKGGTLVLVALVLVPIMAMAMIVIDLGKMRVVQIELQSAADAASLACIQAFDMDTDAASYVAEEFAGLNYAGGEPVVLDRVNDIVFGTFDEASNSFIALAAADQEFADAVRITVRANAIPFHFAQVIGLTDFNMEATATARYKAAGSGNIVGLRKVELKNDAYTDSYNSSVGLYSVASATGDGGVSSNQEVRLNDASVVNGNVFLPPSGSLSGAPNGERIDLDEPLNYPEVDFSSITSEHNNAGIPNTVNGEDPFDGEKLVVKIGDTLNLPPGAYLFKEITLQSNAKLNISDLTRIFITKKIDAENGHINNQSQLPSNLQLYSTEVDPLDEMKLPANFDTHAVLYCPSAKVTKKGSSHFFGAVVAKEFKAEGGGIHADRALLRSERGVGATAILVE